MLLVCSSSTDREFCTTGDVMEVMFGSTSTANFATTAEINSLARTIPRASAWAEGFIGFPLGLATYQETVPAYGTRHLMLSRTPVRCVLRLFDSTSTGTATEYCSTDVRIEDAEAGFLSRDAGFSWTRRSEHGEFSLGLTERVVAGDESRPWLVEYVAGYIPLSGVSTDSPNWAGAGSILGGDATSTSTTLPEDIRYAVAQKAAEYRANPLGVVQRTVGDLSVTYRRDAASGPELALQGYRRSV